MLKKWSFYYLNHQTDICTPKNEDLIVLDEKNRKKVQYFMLDMITGNSNDHDYNRCLTIINNEN